MSEITALLKKELSNHFLKIGFHKHKKFLIRTYDDVICVVDFQKSQYSELLFVNIGIWFTPVALYPAVPPHKCHMQFRVDAIPEIKNSQPSFSRLLDIEDDWILGPRIPVSFEKRLELIDEVFHNYLSSFFSKLSLDYLKTKYQDRWFFPKAESLHLFNN